MSTLLALHQTYREAGAVHTTITGVKRWRGMIVGFALGFPAFFYLLLLAVLVIRYGNLPNYATPYNWLANAWHIIVSTQSVTDMVPIILDEWLFETGYINFDYGHGVAEWSLSIIPHKLFALSLIGALLGLNVGSLLDAAMTGTPLRQSLQITRFGLLTSAGALCAGMTNATVFSVVHCATPSWIGSLAVLGFDSYDLYAIERFGPAISLIGIAMLIVSALLIARGRRLAPQGALSC